jgi:phosphate transport system substrate-binding protein
MKKILFLIIPGILAIQTIAQKTSARKVIKITGTRLAFPLVQRWIDEYKKQHPEVIMQLSSKIPADSADVLIASYNLRAGDVKDGRAAIALTRYVQLPVINSQSNAVTTLQSKGFTDTDFSRIYFGNDNNQLYHFSVYKREKPACASIAFANHFGNEQKDIKGIGVTGDDKDLLNAVKKDTNGISYNNLGFIYDLKSRRVVDSIAIVPIDFNQNGQIDASEQIYGTLDNVLEFSEKTKNSKLMIEQVNVVFHKDNPDKNVIAFLQWVLTKGQRYNHDFGFINLDAATIQTGTKLLSSFTATHACTASGQLIKNRFAVRSH